MAVPSSMNRWWQNWPKTHAFVAERAFFPRSVDEIAEAVRAAEADHRPVRAVGGGWSFSDSSLPGAVTTNRPNSYAVDAQAGVASRAASFPTDPTQPSIGSIVTATNPDLPGSLVMFNDGLNPPAVDTSWNYLGNGTGVWTENGQGRGGAINPNFLENLGVRLLRPVRSVAGRPIDQTDLPGSLVMHDLRRDPMQPLRDWFYNGKGLWSVGVAGDSLPSTQGTLGQLALENRLIPPGATLSVRASTPADTLMVLLAKAPNTTARVDPAYLIDTRSLVTSLQGGLRDLVNDATAEAMRTDADHSPRHFFHVEAGITIAELGQLLSHQSPRLTLQTISTSPGATLAGALSTATHGAEFNRPLLVDRVKAVHLVGPGGLQWWIEGSESIADPDKLLAAYPGLSRERIISGTTPRYGIPPEDWLKAVVVSMGTIGVMYSVILEVVPQFGVREVVVQRTWRTLGFLGTGFSPSNLPALLQSPMTAPTVSRRIVKLMQHGPFNGTGIVQHDGQREVNQYADLAINPNPRTDGDFDTWIGNRELTAAVPIDPQPAPTNEMAEMIEGIRKALDSPDLDPNWSAIYGLGSDWNIVGNVLSGSGAFSGGTTGGVTKLNRVAHASDLIDVALDTALTPMGSGPPGPGLAQHVLTGLLSGLLGTANADKKSDKLGVSVGAPGFPASGVMGAALEIALAPADAFGFVQTQILDRINPGKPFLGYISIRLCRPTDTLMGMQQFADPVNPCSVMVEVVGFGNADGRAFIRDLQQRTVNLIRDSGLEAMLHWGLENDRVTRVHLHGLRALQRPAGSGLNRLDTFKAVRALIRAEAPTTERVFDNAFATRMGLDAQIADQPYDFGRHTLNGPSRTVHFHFPNDGPGPVAMVPPTVDGDFGPHNLTIVPGVTAANPGDEITVDVTFTPSMPGPQTGTLTILTAVPGVPDGVNVIRLMLRAVVDVLAMSVLDPLPIDLGVVRVSQDRTVLLTVRSDSTMDATLASFSLSEPSAETQISVETGPIAVGQTRTYRLTYQPDAVGPLTTDLTLHFTDQAWPTQLTRDVTISLTGVGTGVQAELSPARLEFGSVVVGDSSAALPVQLANVGQEPLVVASLILDRDFNVVGSEPNLVPAGASEQFAIAFEPMGGGERTSELSILSNSAQPPDPLVLHGGGLAQAFLRATPPRQEFDMTPLGSRSGERTITIRNDGVVAVAVATIDVAGVDAAAFRIVRKSRQLPVTLTPEMAVDVTVAFEPVHAVVSEASLDVANDGPTSPHSTPLVGRASAATGLVADAAEVEFEPVDVATTSRTQRVTYTNVDATAAQITAISITGQDAGDFELVRRPALPIDVDPQGSVSLSVRAMPSVQGPRAAALSVTASVPATEVQLRATGLGISVAWSAAVLEFGDWSVGQTSHRQEATIQNTGNRPLVVTAVDTVGDFMVRDLVPTVMTIQPGQWKYLWVYFTPTAIGPHQGAVQVHADGGDVLTLPLTGTGR
jgi:HYDIN/CFA65/VesB-like, Ig-like domain